MKTIGWIRQFDKAACGGAVAEASVTEKSHGKGYSFQGAAMSCKKNCTIVDGHPHTTLRNGKQRVLVVTAGLPRITIFQGNSDSTIHRPITWFNRLLGRNAADPEQDAYTGMPLETGIFTKNGKSGWDYVNNSTQRGSTDFLKQFDLVRWNFLEFNR